VGTWGLDCPTWYFWYKCEYRFSWQKESNRSDNEGKVMAAWSESATVDSRQEREYNGKKNS
jgi:hypothetical protein